MSRRIVFATQEFDPVVPGGAATLIAGLRRSLAAEQRVGVVLVAPGAPESTDDAVTMVDVPAADGTVAWFVERSRRLAVALAETQRHQPIDLVEFTDFEATAIWTMAHRQELGLERVRLAVRLHGPIEAVIAAVGVAPPLFTALGSLERAALSAADVVLVPSTAVGEWAVGRYRLEPDRVVVAPPPVPAIDPVERRPAPQPRLAVFGRLAEQKGTHDLAAVLPDLLTAVPDLTVVLVGADGWSFTEERRMSAVLLEPIPSGLRHRVELLGPLPRHRALAVMADAWAVVLPSRFETFCLAAHEARRAGFPVIAPDLPAFAAFRTGRGFRIYDGTRPGLAAELRAALADPGSLDHLAAEPVPEVGDPTEVYRGVLPAVRHPRSQAGLSTMASTALEIALRPAPAPAAGLARGLLRLLPAPVGRLAVRLLPRRLKDRFRRLASWPEERERRERQDRMRALRRRARGLPAPPDPRVTVVIPCFDSGAWVEDAVASVYAQTLDGWDIVLVDDGSTDPESIRLLDEMASWPRVHLVRQPNAGLPAARNAGIAVARGEFVVPLDADDELDPEFLEVMLGALLATPDAAFAHCWARLFGAVDAVWVPRPDNPYWQRLGNGIVGCVLLRRSAWEAVGGYDATMRQGHEDWELWLRLEEAGWGRARVDRPLFRYRKRSGSMSVLSEAGFEAGLGAIRERHPDLYRRSALVTLKREWYPRLSVIGDGASTYPDDVVVVPSLAAARGKYVADVRVSGAAPGALLAATERLESMPEVAGAAVGEVIVWRQWALRDPASGLFGVHGGSPDALPPVTPDPHWTVDAAAVVPMGIPVMRQRPEEAASLPDWVED